jgi:hypothetical protein
MEPAKGPRGRILKEQGFGIGEDTHSTLYGTVVHNQHFDCCSRLPQHALLLKAQLSKDDLIEPALMSNLKSMGIIVHCCVKT